MISALAVAGLVGSSAALAAAATVASRGVAVRRGWVDRPVCGHKAHRAPIPWTGGPAIAAAMAAIGSAAALGVFGSDAARGVSSLAGAAVVSALAFVLGIVDDNRTAGLSPLGKLAGQVAIGTAAALALGEHPISGCRLLDGGLTIAVLVVAMNALNLQDNSNGTCAGLALATAGGLAATAASLGDSAVLVGASLLVGALLGFLPFNYPRASVFLGDGGSHGIGACLAVLAWIAIRSALAAPEGGAGFDGSELARAAVAFLGFLAVPLADVTWVVFLRIREGRPPWVGDREHLAHRWARAGLGASGATAVLVAVQALASAVSWRVATGAASGVAAGVDDRMLAGVLVLAVGGLVIGAALAPSDPRSRA